MGTHFPLSILEMQQPEPGCYRWTDWGKERASEREGGNNTAQLSKRLIKKRLF